MSTEKTTMEKESLSSQAIKSGRNEFGLIADWTKMTLCPSDSLPNAPVGKNDVGVLLTENRGQPHYMKVGSFVSCWTIGHLTDTNTNFIINITMHNESNDQCSFNSFLNVQHGKIVGKSHCRAKVNRESQATVCSAWWVIFTQDQKRAKGQKLKCK